MQRRTFLHITLGALTVAGAGGMAGCDGQGDAHDRYHGQIVLRPIRLVPGLPVELTLEGHSLADVVVALCVAGPLGSLRGPPLVAPGGTRVSMMVPYPHETLIAGRYVVTAELSHGGSEPVTHHIGGYEIVALRFGA
jgi:hypothetical protein